MGRTKTKHVLAEFSHLLAQVQLLGKNNFICCDCQHLSLFRAMAWMGRTTTHPQMWKQWKFKKRHAWQSAVKGKSVWAFRHVKTKKKKKGFCQSQVELTDQESCWCISTILAITQARQKYFIYPRLTHETFHIVTSQITHCVSGGTQTLMFSYFSLLSLCLYRCLFNSKQTRAHTRWNYITALTVLRTLTVLLHIFAHWLQIIKTSQRLSSLCFQISVFVTRWQSLVH